MVVRTTVPQTNLKARSAASRASVREIDDKHLMQQVKKADVFHSETPSDFERWQMVGLSSVPLKQFEDEQSGSKKQSSGDEGDWNHNQPKGKSSEAVMLYLNGDRNHPVALIDDRRVRPFNKKEGESAFYAASGTGQMMIHTDKGSYLVVVNNPSEAKDAKEQDRVASLRHVTTDKQKRDLKEGEEPEEHVHEGKPEQVDTEVRASKDKIELLDGQTVVAVYSKTDKSWSFSNFKKLNFNPEDEFNVTTKKIVMTATADKFDINGKPVNVNGGGPTLDPFTVPG
jgi:phage gp45-like